MKPELVVLGTGFHNENIEASTHRIVQAGGWKRQKTVIVLPAGQNMSVKVAMALWNMALPPNQPVVRMGALGQEVGEAYSNALTFILDHPSMKDFDYFVTVEHDNVVQPNSLLALLNTMEQHPEFSAIGGLYWQKGENGKPQIWGDPEDPELNFRAQPPRDGEVQECNGLGMGFTVFRLAMFKDPRLPRPWFQTVSDETGIDTQDMFFWKHARQLGYRCAVDTRVKIGHIDGDGKIW